MSSLEMQHIMVRKQTAKDLANIDKQKEKREINYCVKNQVYLSLTCFEDCHSPWMLHIETAMKVPALPVLIQPVAA